ncbi:MAG: SAM-dependent methyltransferase [Bacteroidetes bacterium]|nr:MAG: SAM-dependent methyltransferase [Bacteroidota bacterium]
MQKRLMITEDGSHTLRVDGLNEHYHSTYGALSESLHVFIEAGLHKKLDDLPQKLHILEIGFGTGLNALLTLLDEQSRGCDIYYTGLEAFPLEADLWQGLNYPGLLTDKKAGELFSKLHTAEWGNQIEIVPGFTLTKIQQKLENYQHIGSMADIIYFDAFGPDVQPELWTEEIFQRIADITSPGGILVTYSCKGTVKRALKAAGFEIEKIPGPKGKREMLRGVKF